MSHAPTAPPRKHQGFPMLVALLLAALWLLAGYAVWAERQQIIATKQKELANVVVAVQEQTLRLLQLTEAAVQSASAWLEQHPDTYPGDDAGFVELMTQLRSLSDNMVELRLIDAAGNAHMVPSSSRLPVAQLADREHFKVQMNPATRGRFLGTPLLSRINHQWVWPLSYPVKGEQGRFRVVTAGIVLDRVAAPLEAQRQKPGGSITLLRLDGTTLLRTPNPQDSFGKSIAKAPDFLEQLSVHDQGVYRVHGAFDGVERVVAFGRLRQYPVIVAVTASLDDVLAPWWLQTGRMLALMLLVSAAAVWLAARFMGAERRARSELQRSEKRFRRLVEMAPDAIVVRDYAAGRIVDANPQAEKLFGCSREELLQGDLDRFYADVQPDGLTPMQSMDRVQTVVLRQGSAVIERVLRRPDGTELVCEARGDDISDEGRKLVRVSYLDITERKRAEERLQLAASVFSHAREGIMITDAQGIIIDVNHTFTQISGYSREESLGRKPSMLQSGRHGPEFYARLWDALLGDGHWSGEIWDRRKSGEVYAELLTISAVRDAAGRTLHYVALFSDITPMKEHLSQIEHLAHFDALTRLPNRVLLADRLQQAMAQSQRRQQALVLAYLDLDGFKAVNDRYGHEVGDELLIVLSQRMKGALREGDTLARLGGDEFVALLVDLVHEQDADPVLDRLLEAAATPVDQGGLRLQVSASIGVSVYPRHGMSADLLLRQADLAMYRAKQAGRNRRHQHDPQDVLTPGSEGEYI